MTETYIDFQPAAASSEKEDTLYHKLTQLGLARKIIDIAMNDTKTPRELLDDAAQEIRIAWCRAKAKPEYSDGETASYAYRIARTTALRLRRELGSAVRLPGSAFRKRKDGSSYVTPGVLASPLNWEDLEERLSLGEDAPEGEELGEEHAAVVDALESLPVSRSISAAQADALRARLAPGQWRTLSLFMAGHDMDQVCAEVGLKRCTVLRQLTTIRRVVLGGDSGTATSPAVAEE